MPTKKQRGGDAETSLNSAGVTAYVTAYHEEISPTSSINQEDLERLEGLAHRLQVTRKRRGYPVASEFCEVAGISKQYLGNIELKRTKRPEALPMVKIARALNVSLEWLLTGEGIPAGEVKDILPTEFDLIEGFRSAKPEEKNLIEMILRPYITKPGKPTATAAAAQSKKAPAKKKR